MIKKEPLCVLTVQIHLRAAWRFTPRPLPQTALRRRRLRLRLLLARRPRLPAVLGADELRRAAAGTRPQVSAGLGLRPLRRRKCERHQEECGIHSVFPYVLITVDAIDHCRFSCC